jgi:2-oxoisovalerate dehydrogenase E2 component (dihydrolipoyl transacylase)
MSRFVFRLPDVGEGTAEAELVTLHIKVGDQVEEDQPLAEVMTDKATVEIPSPVSGRVMSITGAPGQMLAVGGEFVVLEVGDGRESAPDTPATAAAPVPTGRYAFRLPDVGEGTAEAELVAWHVKVGDDVAEDQTLAEVMTDKATVEVPSPVAGKVVSLHGSPGEKLAIGSEIVLLEVAGAGQVPTAAPAPSVPPPALAAPAIQTRRPEPAVADRKPPHSGPAQAAFATRTPGERPLAAPAVRRRAWELGVELQFVPGTGPGGRITHEDLVAFVASGGRDGAVRSPARAERHGVEEVKVIGLRRVIAERMQNAKRRIPHFSYIEEVDVAALEETRAQLNGAWGKERGRLTMLPFLIKALARVLPDYPQINARFDDDAGMVHRFAGVHVGVATQTPTGLVVPVMRHAEAMDLWAVAAEVSRLAEAARAGKATPAELSGSTISITSLGALGGLATTPVINYPEVAIIGVNKMIERPVVRDGQIVVRKMMNLSSSFDHRVVDGWDAAEFVQRVRGLLEQPAFLLVD